MLPPSGVDATSYRLTIRTLDVYPNGDWHLGYLALGLAGETGEAVDKIKKSYRQDGPLDKQALALELGDTLWYLTRIADELGYSLEDIMAMNLKKLFDRRARGVQKGSGDNR